MAHGHGLHLVVGHVHGGGAETALQLHDLSAGARAQLGVEVAEGFVHQKHRRLAGDGAPQGHPLLLAAGEFLGQPVEQALQLQGFRHIADALLDATFAAGGEAQGGRQLAAGAVQAVAQLLQRCTGPLTAQAEADVVRHGEVGIQGVALEHHGHIPLGGAQAGDAAIPHKHLTGGGGFQASQQPQQRALAAARWSHQHQEFTVGDG